MLLAVAVLSTPFLGHHNPLLLPLQPTLYETPSLSCSADPFPSLIANISTASTAFHLRSHWKITCFMPFLSSAAGYSYFLRFKPVVRNPSGQLPAAATIPWSQEPHSANCLRHGVATCTLLSYLGSVPSDRDLRSFAGRLIVIVYGAKSSPLDPLMTH